MTISALRSAWVRPLGFAVQLLVFSRDGITLVFGAAFVGSQCQKDEGVPLARHVVNREDYKPSRRSSAPTPPEPLARSASARMRCLYLAVKRRRLACATTSGSGRGFAAAPAGEGAGPI